MAEVKSALKNIDGVRAIKVNSEAGDGYKDGTICTIIAESIATAYGIVYLALFNDFPLPVGIADYRVKLMENEKKVKVKLTEEQVEYLERFPQQMFKFYEEQEDNQGKNPEEN